MKTQKTEREVFWLLVSYLFEAHQGEISDGHGGDGNQIGMDPEGCSYCEVIRDAYLMHGYAEEWETLCGECSEGRIP